MATKQVDVPLEELVAAFDELEDPRSQINRHHPLPAVVVISMMGVLSGADGPTGIRAWAKAKEKELVELLGLKRGLPSRDVIRRVLCALQPEAFQECFNGCIAAMIGSQAEGEKNHIAIDGKTLKGSRDKARGLGPLHLVSAWASERGLTLAQVATDQKSNEITAIPALLKLVDLEGSVITIDAMGTQTKIAEQIVDGKGDDILALKKNQGKVHEAVINFVDEHVNNDFQDVTHERLVEESPKSSHGRIESRTYIQFAVPAEFQGSDRWKGLKTFGLVVYRWTENDVEKMDIRYYLSSLTLSIDVFARCVRSHWGIENTCHWSLDVTYREDSLRSRNRRGTENLAWLRRFTLSLLKQSPGKMSLAMKRRTCGWSWDYLLQILGFQGLSVR